MKKNDMIMFLENPEGKFDFQGSEYYVYPKHIIKALIKK